jgi:hypothetical protein
LLDSSGRTVAQSSNSPSLSQDGVRVHITPASFLAHNSTYRVRVLGGAAGVVDRAGDTLPATYTQASGFTTVPDESGPTISSMRVAPEPVAAVGHRRGQRQPRFLPESG